MHAISETAPRLASRSGEGWSRFRLKEWHYTAITSPRWFLAIGLVQLGYVAEAFGYLVDRSTGASLGEWGERSYGGRALRFARGPLNGETCWMRGMSQVRKQATVGEDGPGWILCCDIPLAGERLQGEVHISEGPGLSLIHPLAKDRPAYTYKANGLGTRASLKLGDRSLDFTGALSTVDWTRSRALRHTRWNWASASGHTSAGEVLGINLSAHVYDDAQGGSRENVLRLGDRLHPVGRVEFSIPELPREQVWGVRGEDAREVDLRFEPLGVRHIQANLGVVRSELLQPWGVFNGSVAGHLVESVFGVAEQHEALW